MIVGIASGKGGTGKTTVAVNLAASLPEPVLLLDCDVEEPNCHLFLAPQVTAAARVSIPVPVLEESKCTSCGLCSKICEYHAIAFLGDRPLIFPELCHGCGGCHWVCPTGALTEIPNEIGVVETATVPSGTLVQGRLHVGRALSPPLIRAVKRHARAEGITLVDSPPGTACSLAAALTGCDFALLVAEPTRFGQYDLSLLVDSVRELKIPCGVLINRSRGRDDPVRAYCREQGIPVLGEIPEREELARAYARGRLAIQVLPELAGTLRDLWSQITVLAGRSTSGRRRL